MSSFCLQSSLKHVLGEGVTERGGEKKEALHPPLLQWKIDLRCFSGNYTSAASGCIRQNAAADNETPKHTFPVLRVESSSLFWRTFIFTRPLSRSFDTSVFMVVCNDVLASLLLVFARPAYK